MNRRFAYGAVGLIHLTGPNNQPIDVNPHAIVSTRTPRAAEHFAPGARCLITTTDGKVIVVMEDCETVGQRAAGK